MQFIFPYLVKFYTFAGNCCSFDCLTVTYPPNLLFAFSKTITDKAKQTTICTPQGQYFRICKFIKKFRKLKVAGLYKLLIIIIYVDWISFNFKIWFMNMTNPLKCPNQNKGADDSLFFLFCYFVVLTQETIRVLFYVQVLCT